MKDITAQLANYASYHRDRRNIASHFIGIPLIVVAVATLLARPALALGSVSISPALIVAALSVAYYFALHRILGLAMTLFMALCLLAGHTIAAYGNTAWLAGGAGLFVLGWAIQFAGHLWEGKKPAFVDDIIGLLIGPLFIVAEWLFAAGYLRPLRDAVTQRAGPSR